MPNRDSYDSIKDTLLQAPATVSDTDTAAVSVSGYRHNLAVVTRSAATGALVITVEDSADNSTFAPVSGATLTLATGVARSASILIRSESVRQYVRLNLVGSGGTPAASAAMVQFGAAQRLSTAVDLLV